MSTAEAAPARAPISSPAISAPAGADPGPLRLAASVLAAFVLSCFTARIIGDPKLEAVVLPPPLFLRRPDQFLAGMWEFHTGNTFGALAFSSYCAFWLSFAAYVKFIAGTLPPAGAHTATGLFLLGWTISAVYMTAAAVQVSGAVFLVFVFATAAAAWYASLTGVTDATWKRTVLPAWPR